MISDLYFDHGDAMTTRCVFYFYSNSKQTNKRIDAFGVRASFMLRFVYEMNCDCIGLMTNEFPILQWTVRGVKRNTNFTVRNVSNVVFSLAFWQLIEISWPKWTTTEVSPHLVRYFANWTAKIAEASVFIGFLYHMIKEIFHKNSLRPTERKITVIVDTYQQNSETIDY